nr:MAG TPA: hypothetical protein [Caudoviricetes sp.]
MFFLTDTPPPTTCTFFFLLLAFLKFSPGPVTVPNTVK